MITFMTIVCTSSAGLDLKTIGLKVIPILVIAFALAWFYLIILRYVRCQGSTKAALCLIGTGIYTYGMDGVIEAIVEEKKYCLAPVDFTLWDDLHCEGNIKVTILLIFIVFAVGLLLYRYGNVKKGRKSEK